jgi:Fe2+ or Zn2+ uptake regulation protein
MCNLVALRSGMRQPQGEVLLAHLREKGFKITAVRDAMIRSVSDAGYPVSVQELTKFLHEKSLSPNKTTLYRELEFLIAQEIIQEIDFGEGKKRYERKTEHCHHHLICTRCQSVQCVELDGDIHSIIDSLEKKTAFKIYEHMLEFFGLCINCRNIKL